MIKETYMSRRHHVHTGLRPAGPFLHGLVCTQDMTIRPALQRRFVADADAAFPRNPTTVYTLDTAHSPFLSMPGQVADIVLKLGR